MIVGVTAEQICTWPTNEGGWHVSPDTYDWVKIGDHARIGDWVKIGNYAKIGNCAEIGGQEHVLHAHVLKYIANAYRVADGSLILRYGCEAHPFAEWTPDAIVEMSKKHEPACAAEYVDALTALTILVRSIFGDV
jgi:hypothetical protein